MARHIASTRGDVRKRIRSVHVLSAPPLDEDPFAFAAPTESGGKKSKIGLRYEEKALGIKKRRRLRSS